MSVEQLQARPGPTEDQIEDYLESVDLNISDVPSKLLMWRRSVRQPYFRSLIQCLRDRFPAMPCSAFRLSFYDPRAIVSLSSCDLPSYGCDLLERLLGVLGQRETAELLTNDGTEVLEPLVDPHSARSEWTHTKSVVRADARLSNCSSTADLVAGLHQYYSSDLFK